MSVVLVLCRSLEDVEKYGLELFYSEFGDVVLGAWWPVEIEDVDEEELAKDGFREEELYPVAVVVRGRLLFEEVRGLRRGSKAYVREGDYEGLL